MRPGGPPAGRRAGPPVPGPEGPPSSVRLSLAAAASGCASLTRNDLTHPAPALSWARRRHGTRGAPGGRAAALSRAKCQLRPRRRGWFRPLAELRALGLDGTDRHRYCSLMVAFDKNLSSALVTTVALTAAVAWHAGAFHGCFCTSESCSESMFKMRFYFGI